MLGMGNFRIFWGIIWFPGNGIRERRPLLCLTTSNSFIASGNRNGILFCSKLHLSEKCMSKVFSESNAMTINGEDHGETAIS